MNATYQFPDSTSLLSPGLVFFKDIIRQNIARMVEMASRPDRLRPHVKTHKTREIVLLLHEAGVTKHKCATIAEAEMLADCKAPDVLLAYPPIGPNASRYVELVEKFSNTSFSTVFDHMLPARQLSKLLVDAGQKTSFLLDLDVGQHRTGVGLDRAGELYTQIASLPGLEPGGLHIYDGHNHQESLQERSAAVASQFAQVKALRESLQKNREPVPTLVAGGTPTFPIYAKMLDELGLECSPGTCVLHDTNYGGHFPDLTGFTPAALVLTRVVGRPTSNRVTFDLGYKAVASDPPADQRCTLLNVPDYKPVLQNEEHLVVETPAADQFKPGDVVYALPTHVCPTCALHRQAYVVEDGKVVDTWDIVGRDRMLSI